MIGAHVMAIMTVVVVGLLRGYDWLRKSHRLSPMGGPINCDTTMFFRLHTRNLLRNWCHSNPFKGIIYSWLVKMFQLYEVMWGKKASHQQIKCMEWWDGTEGWERRDWSTSCQLTPSPPQPHSLPQLLLLTAGAPSSMQSDGWVEGVSPAESVLGLDHCSDLLTPGLTYQLHLSPEPNALPYWTH